MQRQHSVRTTHPKTGEEVTVTVTDYSVMHTGVFRWVVWGGWPDANAWRHIGVKSLDRTKAESLAALEAEDCRWDAWYVTEVLH